MIFIGLDLAPAASGCFALKEDGTPLAELCVTTSTQDHPLKRINDSLLEISAFVSDFHWPRFITIEDFAFAGRYSSFDIAMQAGVIRHHLWNANTNHLLFVPPSSMKGWLAEEGMDTKQRDKKAPAIEWVKTVMGYESIYRRKSEYNHTFDAAVLAEMGRRGYRTFKDGEIFVGTDRQREIFLSRAPNSKGQPKGLFLRDEFYLKPK